MNSDFQKTIQSLAFKTYFRNQLETFGYEDLFADRRVLVVSVTHIMQNSKYLKRFHSSYQDLISLGIDDIYCINSETPLVGPWADKHSSLIKGLPDSDAKFVDALGKHYNASKSIDILSKFWQYMIILNNGEPEKIWQNAFKVGMPWKLIKSNEYKYHGLGPDPVKEYLLDNTK